MAAPPAAPEHSYWVSAITLARLIQNVSEIIIIYQFVLSGKGKVVCRAYKNILDILKLKADRSGYIVTDWSISQSTIIVLIPAPGPDTAFLCQTEAML